MGQDGEIGQSIGVSPDEHKVASQWDGERVVAADKRTELKLLYKELGVVAVLGALLALRLLFVR